MVEAITIDNLTQKYGSPDVVFVDIEGFEAHALQGRDTSIDRRLVCRSSRRIRLIVVRRKH
jgi:FkbM family methyltransferase